MGEADRQNPVQVGDDSILVADQRIVECGALGLGDIRRPSPVGLDGINADADELRVADRIVTSTFVGLRSRWMIPF